MTNSNETKLSVGIIMDGNRRWAKEQGLSTMEGHTRGAEKVRELIEWAKEFGVSTVYLYAFSTENWNRAPEEVNYLMELLARFFSGAILGEVLEKKGRIVFLGDRSRIPAHTLQVMEEAERRTKDGNEGTLAVCLSYGGRTEILAATNALIQRGTLITEEEFSASLWSAGMPDPDIIIRTGGEKRFSNFLTWQSVYSELFFTDTKWPAFTKEEFAGIIEEFNTRERRRGK